MHFKFLHITSATASHVAKPDTGAGNVPRLPWGAGSHSAKGMGECTSHREGRRELRTIGLGTTIQVFLELHLHFRENWSLEMLRTYRITWRCDLNSFFWFHVHALSPSGFRCHPFPLWNIYSGQTVLGTYWVGWNLPEQCVQSCIGGWGHNVTCAVAFFSSCAGEGSFFPKPQGVWKQCFSGAA